MTERFKRTSEDNALYAFDAENNVEPARTIAERIAARYWVPLEHPLVDEITHEIEDAWRLSEKRSALIRIWKQNDGTK